MEEKVALRKDGLIDPEAERFADARRKPIGMHLDDFIASMAARGRDTKHIRTTRTYIERILAQACAEHLSDLTLSAVELAVGADQKGTRIVGPRRQRPYDRREIVRPLGGQGQPHSKRAHELGSIGRQSEDADRRYNVRRPLTETELRKLIATTRTAPEWRKMSERGQGI